MKYKTLKLIAVILLGLGLTGLQAQESVNATGGDASGSGGSASYSVGQVVYTTNTGTSGSVAQGVQQPFEISVGTAVLTYDMELKDITIPFFAEKYDEIQIMGKVKNIGSETITSFDISYTIDGGAAIVYSVTGVNITSGAYYDFTHGTPAIFGEEGSYEIEVTIENINGNVDEDPSNNTLTQTVNIVPFYPAKKVFAEVGTGTWCGFCPRAEVFLNFMDEKYPDTWIGVAVHRSDPMEDPTYINGILPHIAGFPMGLVERAVGMINPTDFEIYYLERMDVVPPATLELSNVIWNVRTREVSFDVNSEFVVDINSELRFNAVIAEDSLWGRGEEWAQTNYYSGGSTVMGGFELLPNPVPDVDMHYDHVGRAILGGWDGTPNSLPAAITAGDIVTYTYTYTVPATMRTDKMTIIGLLIDQSTGEILNANSTDMSLITGIEEVADFDLIVYPNPASSAVNVVFENKNNQPVSIKVYDLMGKVMLSRESQMMNSGNQQIQINVDNFSNGLYFVEVKAGNTKQVHKVSVSK